MLEATNISFKYQETKALENINLTIDKSEVLGVLGTSGSGKSTLLKIIAGLLTPNTGNIKLNGLDINAQPAHLRGIGLVFQDNQLFPHMDVEHNIEFGLKMHGEPKSTRKFRVQELLELIGLQGFEKRKVFELSGGEAKRIALARSLAPSPKLLLLDEPLTGLDKELHDTLLIDLQELLNRTQTTSIFVTHDKNEAEIICDRIFTLSG